MVLTKDRVFWSTETDSHEDIIEDNRLCDGLVAGLPVVLRVEIEPPGENYAAPLDQWRLRIDQDLRPAWHDAEHDETRTRNALKAWVAAKVFTEGEHEVTGTGRYWAYGKAKVTARDGARVEARDRATITALDEATVTARDKVAVTASDTVTVWALNKVKVWAFNESTVWARCTVKVRTHDKAKVTRC